MEKKRDIKQKLNDEEVFEAYSRAEKSLVDYRHIMLVNGADEVGPAPFHQLWSDLLLNGTGNTALEAFRESAKTQYVLRSFLLHAMQYPSKDRDYIVLIKKNSRLAQAKLKEVQREYESNPAIHNNRVQVREQSSEVFSVDCKDGQGNTHNIRIEAYGKGASVRGLANVDRRPKIVIIDDPQDVEDASSPAVQQSDWSWFLSDVMFLGQHTRIFLIGNNLGEACIVERVGAHARELGFEFHRQAVMDDDEPSWPSKYTPEFIAKERENYRRLGKIDIWLRERMCLAVDDETRIFTKNDMRYYCFATTHKVMSDTNNFITVDPATSLKDSADLRAIVVALVDSDNRWYVPEVSYGRWDSVKFFEELFRLAGEYEVREVGIEAGIYEQAIKPFLESEMRRRNQFFTVIPLKHGGRRKEDRIRLLQPRFKTGNILFPEEAWWLPEMESELLAFTMQGTRGLHDDLIDALAYVEQIARVPFRASKRMKALPRVADMECQLI